jgi:SNF2 family DNA or RNA helicase
VSVQLLRKVLRRHDSQEAPTLNGLDRSTCDVEGNPAAKQPVPSLLLGRRGKSSAFLKGLARKSRPFKSGSALASLAASSSKSSDLSGDKVIVFSQWTSMLDIVEVALAKEGFEFRRVDGTMSLSQREQQISDFKTDSNVVVLLLSLRAASLGLNLVVANYVVLLDLWWNPSVEDQAIDRAHRIGQMRNVNVVRITVRDTVEDRILKLQERKRDIINAAFGNAGNASGNRLSSDDLLFLFS